MRRLAIPVLLVALAAGCGSGNDNNHPTLQLSDLPSSASCDNKGISTSDARTGTCVAGSTHITAANKGQWLQMRGYAVRVESVRTADELGQRAAQNFAKDGKFVIVSLAVKNTGPAALDFDKSSDIAYLLVNGTEYEELTAAEDLLPGSLHKDGSSINPGHVGNGTVVFDPPASGASTLNSEGSYVVFLDTDETTNGYPRLGFRSIGFIRLWK